MVEHNNNEKKSCVRFAKSIKLDVVYCRISCAYCIPVWFSSRLSSLFFHLHCFEHTKKKDESNRPLDLEHRQQTREKKIKQNACGKWFRVVLFRVEFDLAHDSQHKAHTIRIFAVWFANNNLIRIYIFIYFYCSQLRDVRFSLGFIILKYSSHESSYINLICARFYSSISNFYQ